MESKRKLVFFGVNRFFSDLWINFVQISFSFLFRFVFQAGKVTEDYWSASLKMLSDLKFLDNLKTFDKDNIPVAIMKRIREK